MGEHYHNVTYSIPENKMKWLFYGGKEEVLLDLLKHFEKEEK